jgi:hypothetical protein
MPTGTKLLAATLLSLITVAHGQSNQGVVFGRVPGVGRDGQPVGLRYTGRADRVAQTGAAETTYHGNVSISFEDGKIVLQADDLIERANELIPTGNVRLRIGGTPIP